MVVTLAKMKYLLSGGESERRVDLLISLTKMDSENTISAIHDHLVKGYKDTDAAHLNDVKLPNFNRAMTRLNNVASIVEKIKNEDWAKLKSLN